MRFQRSPKLTAALQTRSVKREEAGCASSPRPARCELRSANLIRTSSWRGTSACPADGRCSLYPADAPDAADR